MHFKKNRPATDRIVTPASPDSRRRAGDFPPQRLTPLALMLGLALQAGAAQAADEVPPDGFWNRVLAAVSLGSPPEGARLTTLSDADLDQTVTSAPERRVGGVQIAQAPGAGGAPVPPVTPTPRVEADKPAPPPAAAPAGPKFEIRKFEVDGVTLVPKARVDATVAPFIGPGRDFSDVQKALEALEKLFVDAGYGSVQVLLPEQELEQGTVKFNVIEPKLGKVTLEGNKAFSDENIRRSLPALKEGTAPNSNSIAANLRIANENPAKGTTVLLRAGANDGDVDAVVRVSEDPVTRYNVSVDNTGAGGSGAYRWGIGAQTANVWGRDHVFSFQAITSPDERGHFQGYSRDVAIFGAQYHIPLYSLGDSMDFTAGYSNVNSGVVQNIFNVSGRGKVAGVRYTHNLPKWFNVEQKVIWSWDYRAYENAVTPINTNQQIVPDITIHPMALTYAATWRGQNDEVSGYLSLNQNIPGGSDGDSNSFEASRQGARPAYTLWRYGLTYLRSYTHDWQTRVNVAGQWTRDRLVAGEQFGIGGAYSVRGFSERQFSNDYGISANFEVYTPDVMPLVNQIGKIPGENKLRFLVFYDTGHVVRNQPLNNDTARTTLSSTGLGLRYTRGSNVSFRLDAALATLPSQTGGDSTNGTSTPTTTSLKQFRMHGAFVYVF